MQFHLNGFRSGDPEIHDARAPMAGGDLPGEVDVLIVGCGPAGLALAAQLAAFPDIRTAIIEQKPGPLELGQADGIACRTMEMFEAYGFADRLLKEAYWVNEVTFWKPDEAERGKIARSGRIPDTEEGLSEFPHVILNQARVHRFFLDVMRNSPSRLEPHYGRRLVDVGINEAEDPAFPVTARIERVDGGEVETIRARYLAGCDGARSAVRKSLGIPFRGDSANQAWGVMDVLAVTDFPDIRRKATVHSASEGNMIIIPREGGYLVRLYIELDELAQNERVSARNITSDHLVAAAQRILHPYSLDVKEIAWWSVYEIGQRLCDRFDDAGEGGRLPHVFIAGDACHTHSPKAGQGMNVSLRDGFNLGWKLTAVISGRSRPELLKTYSAERHAVAKELIDFDRKLARMFSAPPKDANDPDSDGVDPAEFQRYFIKQGRFMAGTETRYAPSLISASPVHQHLAQGFPLGMRFHSAPAIRLADGKPMQLGHVVKADGRWRIFAFAGSEDPADPSARIVRLCDFLARSPASPLGRYTPKGGDIDAVIDVRAVFQQPYHALALEALPALLKPRKGRYGLIDYEKMFCADPGPGRDIFDLRSIDRKAGCMVVVRPDQHVANVLPLDAHEALGDFFAAFMLEPVLAAQAAARMPIASERISKERSRAEWS